MLEKSAITRRFAHRVFLGTMLVLPFLFAAPVSLCAGQSGRAKAGAEILEADRHTGSLIGLQYETFFTPHNGGDFSTAEAVPILGKYSSNDVNVIRRHEAWFEDLGIDWLLLDWSNMLWMRPEWEKHQGATSEIEQTTSLLFQTYRQMEKEGSHPPKLVIMLGLQNGRRIPDDAQRLNGIIAWLKTNFLDRPEDKDLWLYYHGRPLLTILFHTQQTCAEADARAQGIVAPDWTIRWMAAQLQSTHMEKCGFWSWMDGTIRQIVTRRDGRAEETVVTPSAFPIPDGWLDPRAVGRDHGAPYLESWEVAFENRPKFIQIHQWNEFAGQLEGRGGGPAHDIYGDEYNLEFSDDLEPAQMSACAYRGCGGWGYYYMNLTRAILSLYRGATPDITVLALSASVQPIIRGKGIPLQWKFLGRAPASYTLELDGKVVAENLAGSRYRLPLATVPSGKHRVTLRANGVHTYFDLSPQRPATRSRAPLPVTSEMEFEYSP